MAMLELESAAITAAITAIDPDKAPGDFEGGLDAAGLRGLVHAIGEIVARAGLDLSRGLTIVIDPKTRAEEEGAEQDAALLVGWRLLLPVPEVDWDRALKAYLEGCETFAREGVFQLLYDRTGDSYYCLGLGVALASRTIRLARFHRDWSTGFWKQEAK